MLLFLMLHRPNFYPTKWGVPEKPISLSHQIAVSRSLTSLNLLLISCAHSGIPSSSKAYGILIAGTPAVVQGAWNIGCPVVSEVGAPERAVGVSMISQSINFSESFAD